MLTKQDIVKLFIPLQIRKEEILCIEKGKQNVFRVVNRGLSQVHQMA